MCGIVGYVGKKQVVPIIIEGLRRLEYRGYDSAGIAVAGNGDRSSSSEALSLIPALVVLTSRSVVCAVDAQSIKRPGTSVAFTFAARSRLRPSART